MVMRGSAESTSHRRIRLWTGQAGVASSELGACLVALLALGILLSFLWGQRPVKANESFGAPGRGFSGASHFLETSNANTSGDSGEDSEQEIRRRLRPQNVPEALAPILRLIIGAALFCYGLSLIYRAEDGCNRLNVVGFLLTLAGSLILVI